MTWFRKQLNAYHAFDIYGDNYPVLMERKHISFDKYVIYIQYIFS